MDWTISYKTTKEMYELDYHSIQKVCLLIQWNWCFFLNKKTYTGRLNAIKLQYTLNNSMKIFNLKIFHESFILFLLSRFLLFTRFIWYKSVKVNDLNPCKFLCLFSFQFISFLCRIALYKNKRKSKKEMWIKKTDAKFQNKR